MSRQRAPADEDLSMFVRLLVHLPGVAVALAVAAWAAPGSDLDGRIIGRPSSRQAADG